ncbi:hypothetical protein ZWY2020_023371 [Hordeum vulgare]|nr:hypothetical protein ZWY2020_023371 [Hordeum vulgare]
MAANLHALLRAKLRCRLTLHAAASPFALHTRRPPPPPPPRLHDHASFFMPARGLAARASKKKKDAAAAAAIPVAAKAGDCDAKKADAAAKMVTATKKGAAVLDLHIPDDMKKSSHVLQLGYNVLKRISNALPKADPIQLEELTGEFYTVIPHDFGFKKMREFIIDTPEKLKAKLEMVEALGEIEIATRLLEDDQSDRDDPLYARYKQLHCDFTPLEVDSEEYSMIKTYLTNTHAKRHSGYTVDIEQIFTGDKAGRNRAVSEGLRIAPPEAPSTGYMFGKGVYFADMFSKSATYCYPSQASRSGVLLLCEVSLGDMNELLNGDINANNLPEGKLSTKGVGKTAPDMAESKITDDGVVIPLGKPKKVSRDNGVLYYNEYIVYNLDQIRMRYALQVSFNYKQ